MKDIEILKKKDTPLLSRQRVSAMAYFEGKTPSRLELKELVAKKVSADPNLVVIRHIYQRYGSKKAKVICHVYKDEKAMKTLELETLIKKHTKQEKKEEKTEAPKPKEEVKPEETPKEEVKPEENEEPKAEEAAEPTEEKPAESAE